MNRFLSLRWTALVLSIAIGLSLTGPAAAQTIPHFESCDGQLTSITAPKGMTPGTMTGVGQGTATTMGKYQFMAAHNFTNDGKILNGKGFNIAADGATIKTRYSGTFGPTNVANVVWIKVRAEYYDGTGRLAGVTGVADVVATLNFATGLFHYDTAGTWKLP